MYKTIEVLYKVSFIDEDAADVVMKLTTVRYTNLFILIHVDSRSC